MNPDNPIAWATKCAALERENHDFDVALAKTLDEREDAIWSHFVTAWAAIGHLVAIRGALHYDRSSPESPYHGVPVPRDVWDANMKARRLAVLGSAT